MENYHKYQEAARPLPTRAEERAAMETLRDSWVSQPYHKLYMNEPIRANKIDFSERQKATKL
jgi:hypothetical protein